MIFKLLAIAIFCALFFSCQQETKQREVKQKEIPTTQTETDSLLYSKAGTIRIADSYSQVIKNSETVHIYEIDLTDIEKYNGYINGELAAGFIMTKTVLDSLYPGEIPVRGCIKLAVTGYNDLLVAASYITGARLVLNKKSIEKSNLFLDPSLISDSARTISMIFGRTDSPKQFKVTFNGQKLASPENQKTLQLLYDKVREESITNEEKTVFQNMVYNQLRKVIIEKPEGLIKVETIHNYKFTE